MSTSHGAGDLRAAYVFALELVTRRQWCNEGDNKIQAERRHP